MGLNLRAAVLHVNAVKRESNSPPMRIARYTADVLGIPLIHNLETAKKHAKEKFDIIFMKYGLLKFSEHRDYAMAMYAQAKTIVNLENDYTMVPDVRFRRLHGNKEYHTWSTVEDRTNYVNWNVLTPFGWGKLPLAEPTMEGLLYWGAARPDRMDAFEHYFTGAPYPVTISTYRGKAAFAEACGPKVQFISALRDMSYAAHWPATLYIEDKTSHDLYCSPANRFYEALQLGMAQAIDHRAVPTLERAGLDVLADWVVATKKDVRKLLKHSDDIRKAQRACWGREDYCARLRSQVTKACRATFGAKCGV